MRNYIVLFTFLLIPILTYSQRYTKSGNYNRIGIQGKLGTISIDTDNFTIDGESAFLGGFTTRGRLYNNFGVVYGIDLLNARVQVKGRSPGQLRQEDIGYTLRGAQLHLLGSYNIVQDRLALDFGPALLVNGAMNLDRNAQRDTIIDGFESLTAEDIREISTVNPFGIIGITAGFTNVRLTAQYQVGFTNILNNLNSNSVRNTDPAASNFSGRASLLTAGIVLLL